MMTGKVFALGSLALAAFLVAVTGSTLHAAAGVSVNSPVPDLTLPDASGAVHHLTDFKGQVVLIDFWASWCVPCKTEFPALNRLWKEHGGADLVILAVAEDSAERVAPFVKDHGVEFPVLIDQYGGAMRAYGVSVIPVSVVVDRAGMIRAVMVGPRDYGSPEAVRFFDEIAGKGGP